MKEQWKKLDSDAKLLLNVEEGRSLPIQVELPLSPFSQGKHDCYNKILVTLRVFVLLTLLVLLSWAVYTNYCFNDALLRKHDDSLTETNKITFNKKVWAEDVKNLIENDTSVSEEKQEKIKQKLTKINSELLDNVQDMIRKVELEQEVPENTIKQEVNVTETQKGLHEHEIVPFKLIDKVLVNDLKEHLENEPKKIEEKNKSFQKEESVRDLILYEKNEIEEPESDQIPFELPPLRVGLGQIFPDDNQNNVMQTFFQTISEDSDEVENHIIDAILSQVAKDNQDLLDEFIKTLESISSTENGIVTEQVNDESTDQNNIFNGISEDNESSLKSVNQSCEEIHQAGGDIIAESIEQSFEYNFMQADIYLLMARRIEEILGEYNDLLIWYFTHRNEPEPMEDGEQVKFYAARLLFGKDITEFSKYSIFVVSFLTNDDYTRDLNRLIDESEPKPEAKTITQTQIVNRLITKSHLCNLYIQGKENVDEISDTIESINLLDLKLTGVNVNAFLKSLKVIKATEDSAEEHAPNEYVVDTQKNYEATTKIVSRNSSVNIISHDVDSKESTEMDIKESNDVTSSVAEVSNSHIPEKNDDQRQAFIQALQVIAEITEAENASDEPEINNEQSINEDGVELFSEASNTKTEETTSSEFVREQEEFLSEQELNVGELKFDKNYQAVEESEEIPSWKSMQILQSVNEQDPVIEEVNPNENYEMDVAEDELSKRLHSFMEDILNSKDESEESVDMNDFLTIYDGYDY